jgi:hypothetical protein
MTYPFQIPDTAFLSISFPIIAALCLAISVLLIFSLLVWIPGRANQWFGQSVWSLAALPPLEFAPRLYSALSKSGFRVDVIPFSSTDTRYSSMVVQLNKIVGNNDGPHDGIKILFDTSCWDRHPRLPDWQRTENDRLNAKADVAWVIRSKFDGMGTSWLASHGFTAIQHQSLSQLIKWLNKMNAEDSRMSLSAV